MAFEVAVTDHCNCPAPSEGHKWFQVWRRRLSVAAEFSGENAYDVLGVSEKSNFSEIKASFRKLAKQTHPDLQSHSDAASTRRFLQILAAYQILSDSKKRAHYDRYLLSQRMILQKQPKQSSSVYTYNGCVTTANQMEVVEWLKWYRHAVNDILSRKEMAEGSGCFEKIESEFYSAIHAAYYGPIIDSMDLLPDCFEAEERSADETAEVLHLVSGRDLFGLVRIVNGVSELSHGCFERLTSTAMVMGVHESVKSPSTAMSSYLSEINFEGGCLKNEEAQQMQNIGKNHKGHVGDVYKDLELHIAGREVAIATRMPPKSCYGEGKTKDSLDQIRVFLSLHEDRTQVSKSHSSKSVLGSSVTSRILLGTITGLGTNPEEASCFVYNNSGAKTHMIMKHRTMMVKHMHWYQVGNEVSVCECRCSRACLPPSKFWLFEPRCGLHDIGGWYVETFGRDKKGRTVLSRRQWYDCNAFEPSERLDMVKRFVLFAALAHRQELHKFRGQYGSGSLSC